MNYNSWPGQSDKVNMQHIPCQCCVRLSPVISGVASVGVPVGLCRKVGRLVDLEFDIRTEGFLVIKDKVIKLTHLLNIKY